MSDLLNAGNNNDIDRIGPTRRPDRSRVMLQNWRDLLFLHWEHPADELRSLLPSGLELDLYNGKAYLGLVPFTMTHVRPAWAPSLPWLSFFHETNVRTYVRHGRHPGVWFFSLDAANPIACSLARTWFNLPYYWASMELNHLPDQRIAYRSRRRSSTRTVGNPGCRIECRPVGSTRSAEVGSLEFFLFERYFLFADRRGKLLRGQVHHAPYPIQDAQVLGCEQNLIEAAALSSPRGESLAHFSPGVDVEVFALEASNP